MALKLVSLVTLSSGFLYVLQTLIKSIDEFENLIGSSARIYFGT